MTAGPDPRAHARRVWDGFRQPFAAVRLLAGDRALLRQALVPAAYLGAFCAAWALLRGDGLIDGVRTFHHAFAWLAPVPTVLMAAHYARFATEVRARLGMGPCAPCISPLGVSLRRAIGQAVLVAVAVAPVVFLAGRFALVGGLLAKLLAALWALHWIVIDAFDSARVLAPGQTVADLDRLADAAPRPWFVRGPLAAATHLPGPLAWPVRRFAGLCDRLARPLRDEIALAEAHPSLLLGFGVATALLLATPVLNLFFRPVVLVAATRVLGSLGAHGARAEAAGGEGLRRARAA